MTLTLERAEMPPRKRWTREEYRRLSEAGFLPGHYELIDGEIIEKVTQKPPHRIVVILFATWLQNVFGHLNLQVQAPIVLPLTDDDSMEPEPDVAVTHAPTTSYQSDNPHAADLLLVGEVSDTTLSYDRGTKATPKNNCFIFFSALISYEAKKWSDNC